MTSVMTTVQATLAAWREQGAASLDPMRFQRIEALALRADDQGGAVRHLLEERLAALIDAYSADLDLVAAANTTGSASTASGAGSRPALSALLAYLADQAQIREGNGGNATAASPPTTYPLDEIRRLCAHARTESQLRQALEQAPEDAGPLNSANLVHRALSVMRGLSPEYLHTFLGYVDTLARLEGMGLHYMATAAAPSTTGGKRTRSRKRQRLA